LPALEARQKEETNSKVKRSLREAIAMIQLASEDSAVKQKACEVLGELGSIPSQDALKTVQKAAEAAGDKPLADAAAAALDQIASHVKVVNTVGTVFRGVSNGSVLLVIAIGLAITFGLMGVINMANGELIAVGAYTAYVVQRIFGEGLALSPFGMDINLPGMHKTGTGY